MKRLAIALGTGVAMALVAVGTHPLRTPADAIGRNTVSGTGPVQHAGSLRASFNPTLDARKVSPE